MSIVDQIKTAHEQDQAKSAEPINDDDLPVSYERITDRWLTGVLCSRIKGAAVLSHAFGAPDTGSSNRRKLAVEYNDAGRQAKLPQALFCKATHDLANRVALGVYGGGHSEV